MVANKFYTLEDMKIMYEEEYYALGLDKLYLKSESSEATTHKTVKPAKKEIIARSRANSTKLFIVIMIIGLILAFFSISQFRGFRELLDIKYHFQKWNLLGGYYETDYLPYVNRLKQLCETEKFFMEHRDISISHAMLGTIGYGLGILFSFAIIVQSFFIVLWNICKDLIKYVKQTYFKES